MALQITLTAADRKRYAAPEHLTFNRHALDEVPGSTLEAWEAQLPAGKSVAGILIQDYPAQTSFGRRALAWIAWQLTAPDSVPAFADFDPATSGMKQKLVRLDADPPAEAPSAQSQTGADGETSSA